MLNVGGRAVGQAISQVRAAAAAARPGGRWVSAGRSGGAYWEHNAAPSSVGRAGRSANNELGRLFNRSQRHRYDYNELYVAQPTGGYKILDSYNPRAGEIVSRKFTQLSEIEPKSAIGYLNEIVHKYKPGYVIANVPTSGELPGRPLLGRMILEVPIQTKPVPQSVLDAAAKRNILIRDVLRKVY